MSRVETYREGRVPLHTLRADIEFGTRRGPHQVRDHRRQGLDLQGRGAPAPQRAARRLPESREPESCFPPSEPSTARSRRATTAASRTAAATSSFGDFAMQAIEPGRVTSRQIEAARMAITRHVKRAGKLWIRIFPDRPVTKKPLEVRMGGGKGARRGVGGRGPPGPRDVRARRASTRRPRARRSASPATSSPSRTSSSRVERS